MEGVLDEQIAKMFAINETCVWYGKPQKKCHVLGAVIKMLPFVLLWLAFDSIFIVGMIFGGVADEAPSFIWAIIVPFFAFHLMPVWIWIAGIVKAVAGYKNITYCVTNERIIVKTGLVGTDIRSVLLKEVDSIDLSVSFLDKLCKTGDLKVIGKTINLSFTDLINPEEVYTILNNCVMQAKEIINE